MTAPTPYDHPLRWLCPSASRPAEVHLVDLSEAEPECSCEDHICRKRICKHIAAVIEAIANQTTTP